MNAQTRVVSVEDLSAEQMARITAFKEEYIAICRKYGLSLVSCSCCGGLGLIGDDLHIDGYERGPLNPNEWE